MHLTRASTTRLFALPLHGGPLFSGVFEAENRIRQSLQRDHGVEHLQKCRAELPVLAVRELIESLSDKLITHLVDLEAPVAATTSREFQATGGRLSETQQFSLASQTMNRSPAP